MESSEVKQIINRNKKFVINYNKRLIENYIDYLRPTKELKKVIESVYVNKSIDKLYFSVNVLDISFRKRIYQEPIEYSSIISIDENIKNKKEFLKKYKKKVIK